MAGKTKMEIKIEESMSEIKDILIKHITTETTEKIYIIDEIITDLRRLKNKLFRLINEDESQEQLKQVIEDDIEKMVTNFKNKHSELIGEICEEHE